MCIHKFSVLFKWFKWRSISGVFLHTKSSSLFNGTHNYHHVRIVFYVMSLIGYFMDLMETYKGFIKCWYREEGSNGYIWTAKMQTSLYKQTDPSFYFCYFRQYIQALLTFLPWNPKKVIGQTRHNVAPDQSLHCLLIGFSIKKENKSDKVNPTSMKWQMDSSIIQRITVEESTVYNGWNQHKGTGWPKILLKSFII